MQVSVHDCHGGKEQTEVGVDIIILPPPPQQADRTGLHTVVAVWATMGDWRVHEVIMVKIMCTIYVCEIIFFSFPQNHVRVSPRLHFPIISQFRI